MPWVSQKQYDEEMREAKWKMEIELRQKTHENDCTEYRKLTQGNLSALHEALRANKEIWTEQIKEVRMEQKEFHKQNRQSLLWQRGLLFTILLALLGFAGEQVWSQIVELEKQVPTHVHSEKSDYKFDFNPMNDREY